MGGSINEKSCRSLEKVAICSYPGGGDVTEAGWFLRKGGGIQAAGHEGGVRGYRACLWIMEEAKAAAVVLVNISSFPAGKTGLRLLEKLMAAAAD